MCFEFVVLGAQTLVVHAINQQRHVVAHHGVEVADVHHGAGIAVHQDCRLHARADHSTHCGGHHLPDATEEVARHHNRAALAEQNVGEARRMAATYEQVDIGGHQVVQRQAQRTRVERAFFDFEIGAVFPRVGEFFFHFARPAAHLLEVALGEFGIECCHAGFTVGLHVVIRAFAARQQDMRFGVDVDELGFRIQQPFVRGVAVQAGTHGHDDVGIRQQADSGFGGIGAGDADVILIVTQPVFGLQRGGNQRTGARSQRAHFVARARPHRAATNHDHRPLGFGEHIGGLFNRGSIRRYNTLGDDRGRRAVRLVVVPFFLLQVHRHRQQHRT